jgi:hypothetical protein
MQYGGGRPAVRGQPERKPTPIVFFFFSFTQAVTASRVTSVSTATPIEDFRAMMNSKVLTLADDGVGLSLLADYVYLDFRNNALPCFPAVAGMAKVIEKFVTEAFGGDTYGKALDCLRALREECKIHDYETDFNSWMKAFKDKIGDEDALGMVLLAAYAAQNRILAPNRRADKNVFDMKGYAFHFHITRGERGDANFT